MLNLHSLDMYTAHLKYVSQLGSVGATFFFRLCALSWLLWTQTYSSALRGRGGGASPHFWSKGQTYLLLDIMKYLDIKGFLHTSQRRPLKNVAEGLKQVGSICTVLPQTATGHFST